MKILDTPDIAKWVDEYAAGLLKRAMFKISDTEIAKDVVQDTFLAATEKLHTFKGESSPKTWLYSILNFKIIDYYRSKARQTVSPASQSLLKFFTETGEWNDPKKPRAWEDDDSHILDDPDFRLVMRNCLEALPEKWNACISMKYYLDKKGDEICQDLGITPTNLWQIIHRSKLNLRDCIETNWYNDH
ncbi:MAG: sigma-70 family RNA polymerase sigma factor [Chlorobi bacterium]|nr:sigma-70 family RNA polymerase sigma factor [Chlorobiota bacterium]